MLLQHILTIIAFSIYHAQLVLVCWSDQSSGTYITLHCIIPVALGLTNIL